MENSKKEMLERQGISPYKAGFLGVCPRCGQGKLIHGLLSLEKQCSQCHLDYDFADSADGPAIFAMLFVGFIVTGLALWLELRFEPSIWLHIALWFPLTVLLSIAFLRPMKGIMIALQYVHDAREVQRNKADE